HIEYTDRPRDILDLLLAPIVEAKTEFIAHLVAHDPAHADSARGRQGFETGGDVDAIAVDVPTVLDDVAEVDADAELGPPVRRHIGVARGHLALHLDRAADRVDDAHEFDQEAVAHGSDDAAAVLLDLRVGQCAAQHPQPFESALFVLAHQSRVAHHIGCQDRCQPPFYFFVHSCWGLPEGRILAFLLFS